MDYVNDNTSTDFDPVNRKYLKSFSDIKSKVQTAKYNKNKKDWWENYIQIIFKNKKEIIIYPEAKCCSTSYIIKFVGYPFSKLV